MSVASPYAPGRPKPAWRRRLVDRCFVVLCVASASISVLILVVLLGSIVARGWSRLSWVFLTSYPSGNPAEAGLKAALWGSIWLCVVCMLLAVPIGVGTAVLLEEYAPRGRGIGRKLHSFIQLNIRNLAGVPSIVYGIIGLTVFVRCFGVLGNPNQYDLLTRAELTNGSVTEGFLVEDQASSIVVDVIGVAGAERSEGMPLPEGTEINLAFVPADAPRVLQASPGETVELALVRDFNFPLELGFALVPLDDAAAPPTVHVTGVLREFRPGRLVLALPGKEATVIPAGKIRTRSTRAVRAHELRLTSGEVLRGSSLREDGSRWILSSDESKRTIDQSAITEYHPIGPLAIGSEDSIFYFRIPLGGSVLAGALTLMLVVLPVIIISSQEALRGVPRSLREGAYASGATRWQMVSRMVLPSAVPGIMTGVILSMSRAIGEAAPLLVVGGVLFITFTPTNVMSDFAALPLQIYQWASRPQPEFYSIAAAGIIVLVTVLLAFNLVAILIRQRFQKYTR